MVLDAGSGKGMKRHYCTYFDHHYLNRGLALYRSLSRYSSEFHLYVLCMDSATCEILSRMALPDMTTIPLEDLETHDPELLAAKHTRSVVEYYFTCSPLLPLLVLERFREIDLLTYLDSDLFFFSDPAPLFEELANNSIAIIGHRFPPRLRDNHERRYGVFNVGWLTFRRDAVALDCLRWWRERCLEWCYDRHELGRFADQKYLDEWPSRFAGVKVLEHKGANLAPWNVENYMIRDSGSNISVDDQTLICFHFQGLKKVMSWVYNPNFQMYGLEASATPDVIMRRIFRPYITTLVDVSKELSKYPYPVSCSSSGIRNDGKSSIYARMRRLASVAAGFVKKRYFLIRS